MGKITAFGGDTVANYDVVEKSSNPMSKGRKSSENKNEDIKEEINQPEKTGVQFVTKKITDMASAVGLMSSFVDVSKSVSKAFLQDPKKRKIMEEAGEILQDARETAGISLTEIRERLGLENGSVVESAEQGKSLLPFDLILRLASLLARHDPIPFVMRLTKIYYPSTYQALEVIGLSGIYSAIEREKRFINIYRRRDDIRDLSDEEFDGVLEFIEAAFDMGIRFIAQHKTHESNQ